MGLRSGRIGRQPFQGQTVRNRGELQRCHAAIQQGGAKALVKLPGNLGYAPAADRLQLLEIGSAARSPQIGIPEMIAISDKLSIMKGEVTVGLFKQVMQGCEITGYNAEELQAILADPSQEREALTCLNLDDAREFANRLSEQTSRKFRVQTEEEWLAARGQLSGNNWTWTETKYDENTFVLRRLGGDSRSYGYPGSRYSGGAVRLVEDK